MTLKPTPTAGDSLLAVDAGGTKTAVWLVEAAPADTCRVLGRGRSTAGNPLSVGFADATRAIAEAIARAQADGQQAPAPARRAILSVAGAFDPELRRQLVDWAHRAGIAQQVAVVSDVVPVLAAGTEDCCGVAVVSGTGSVSFARSADGRTVLCGGWGYLLGDEGSGYAIGRDALTAALHAIELGDQQTPICRAVFKALAADSVSALTKTLYRHAEPRALVASLAPMVISLAEQGEATAKEILDSAARDLAQIVARAASAVELDGNFALAAAGGVLVGSEQLRIGLASKLRQMGLHAEVRVVNEPLEGCVRLAAPEFAGTLVDWQ